MRCDSAITRRLVGGDSKDFWHGKCCSGGIREVEVCSGMYGESEVMRLKLCVLFDVVTDERKTLIRVQKRYKRRSGVACRVAVTWWD